jgi:hypothetical protein
MYATSPAERPGSWRFQAQAAPSKMSGGGFAMPMHDWSRVDANVYHHFHQFWTTEICRTLNNGLLPPGYSALVEQHAGSPQPDVLTLERRSSRSQKPARPRGGVMAAPPRTRHVFRTEIDSYAARGNRISIRHRLGDIVCVIELVSPGNKHSRIALRQFVEKAVSFLRSGVHLLILDPFPPTPRDPEGIHRAIFGEIHDHEFHLPPDKPLTLAAYAVNPESAGLDVTAYVEPVGVGDALPDMPAYIDADEYVGVPLEATYQAAWANCPADMRELVETGRLAGEE